ncbi:MAG: hypothetical protein J0H57_12240 [Rhodospirillales bacterium]|nr:hypothetical protein [Rhodospirillales bacterium]
MRAGKAAEKVGATGKHFAAHRSASGQDFEQSGKAGFSLGQHGMASDMEAVSDMPAIGASSIATALDGVAIGAVRRPTIARIESRRGMSDKSCTLYVSHKPRINRSTTC